MSFQDSVSGPQADDDEASLRLAVQLDAELNGHCSVHSPAPVPLHQPDLDADLAFAIKLDYELNQSEQTRPTESVDLTGSSSPLFLPASSPPSFLRGGGKEDTEMSKPKSLSTLKDFLDTVVARRCTKCNTQLVSSATDVEKLFQPWVDGTVPVSSWLKCRKCSTNACIACRSISPTSGSSVNVARTKISWCCSRGRLFVIWIILCGFDQAYITAKKHEASTTGKSGMRGIEKGSGVGYGGNEWNYNIGRRSYGGRFLNDRRQDMHTESIKAKAVSAEMKADTFNGTVLAFLVELLPSLDRQSRFDLNPPQAVNDLLLSSKLLDFCAELLRNDSLDDASKRKALYDALLNLLRVVGTHPVTAAPVIFQERPVRTKDENILSISFQQHGPVLIKETSTSLAEGLKNLSTQSVSMLKQASVNEREFHSDEGQDLLWLCRQIADLAEYLLMNSDRGGKKVEHSSNDKPKDHGIFDVPDKEIFGSSHFATAAMRLQRSRPGRIKRLITEITSLETGLPPGIFVKYASSRLDLIKFIIVGPNGTPYENGLFEFDLFCPEMYPDESPQCFFRGAGSGLHWNPNLHTDGKVCLSLLGTWQGEPWRPGESTILQVLVSIQAMIFCDEPFYNEPVYNDAYLRDPSRSHEVFYQSQSKAYSKCIYGMTVRYAILNWLTQPPKIWKDIAAGHFKRNANRILQTAEKWAEEQTRENQNGDPTLPVLFSWRQAKEAVPPMLPELEASLKAYGATYKLKQPTPSRPQNQPNIHYRHGGHGPGYGGGSGGYVGGFSSGFNRNHGGNHGGGYGGFGGF